MVLIAGCAPETGEAGSTPVASSAPADPAPMTVEEAGAYYLKTVCPTNTISGAFYDVINEQGDRYNEGLAVEMEPVKKAAAKLRDSYRDQADAFSDEEVLWPTAVEADIKEIADATYDDVAVFAQLSQAEDLPGAGSVLQKYADETDRSVAQRIRAKLDLSADTQESCKKYTDN